MKKIQDLSSHLTIPPDRVTDETFVQNKAQKQVTIFYVVLFLIILYTIKKLHSQTIIPLNPLWPIFWINLIPLTISKLLIESFAAITTLLVIKFPNTLNRFLTGIAFLELVALSNSFGKMNHSLHLFLLVALIFIFLPEVNQKKDSKKLYILIFWAAQAMILLTYSMAGFWKIMGILIQSAQGHIHAFIPQSIAYQTAARLFQTNDMSVVGHLFITYPVLGWPLYLFALYLEFFAFLIAFRPSLHKVWAFGLIAMHLGIAISMKIYFIENIFILVIFFIFSPFSDTKRNIYQVIKELPILEFFYRK